MSDENPFGLTDEEARLLRLRLIEAICALILEQKGLKGRIIVEEIEGE